MMQDTHSQPTLGNVGFIFTNADLNKTRDVILAEKVAAPARAGAVAPLDVFVPAGNTGALFFRKEKRTRLLIC